MDNEMKLPWVVDLINESAILDNTGEVALDVDAGGHPEWTLISDATLAAFIVRAVNNHGPLIAALSRQIAEQEREWRTDIPPEDEDKEEIYNQLVTAIKAAKGEA